MHTNREYPNGASAWLSKIPSRVSQDPPPGPDCGKWLDQGKRSWGASQMETDIQTHTEDWNAVAELSRVRLLMERVVALDEDYRYGQAHMYLGVLNSILPASLGGRMLLSTPRYICA